ncbi:MAG: small ribosomal subunit Rsm22 family protein [Treponema sp.]|jgi:hypothetical protein|nr:small ribosomal subunit Rsm22 family protein [Treponema sp.]
MTTPNLLFPGLEEHTRKDLEALLPLIEKTFPIPARFRRSLGQDVAELSRLLTSARGERSLSYLNQPPLLSAYLYYFLPWNLYRLCRLLPGLDIPLAPGDTIIDLGSGPLSFPIGLWLCRRDLRSIPLNFRCLDRSKGALEAGKKLFAALGDPSCPWTITTVHSDITQGIPRPHKPIGRNPKDRKPTGAALVTALNLYNELSQSISPGDDARQRRFAHSQAALLAGLAAGGGRLLVLEPGTPPSSRFITLLREALIKLGRPPLSPCTHCLPCPFPAIRSPAAGRDAKWCHFAFDTEDAPAKLHRLSAAAGIPKERAILSFLLAGPHSPAEQQARTVRVISSPFPVSGGAAGRSQGRYVCGEKGMALLRGEESFITAAEPGTLLTVTFTGEQDPKSGVPVVTYTSSTPAVTRNAPNSGALEQKK